jgi:hypothetical protein
MTNREKRKILDANLNPSKPNDLTKLVHLKYENNRTRIVAPIEPETKEQKALLKENPNLVFVIQTDGYSKRGLSKSRQESVRLRENTRTFELNKILTVKEIKTR